MRFALSGDRLRELSIHAVLGTTKGRIGLLVAAIVAVLAFVVKGYFQANASALARSIHARDDATVHALGIAAFAIILFLSVATTYATWRSCNVVIGTRLDQEIQLSRNNLLYSFRPLGFFNPQTRVVVLADPQNMYVEYDESMGVITIRGVVYTSLCRNVSSDWPTSTAEMDRLDSYQIPNCFIPNLYESLVQNSKKGQ